MSNVEEAPVEIFEWLEKFDFQDLPEKDRTIVLNYFTGEEYEEMRSATRILNSKAAEENTSGYKSLVLGRFDEQHKGKSRRPSVQFIWKLAAALLPFMLIAVTYWFAKGQDQAKQVSVVHDTVYFQKSSQETTIYDTVFIEKIIKSGDEPVDGTIRHKPSQGRVAFQSTSEIDVVPFSEKEEVQNTIRNYSVRDDSLFNLFPSVAL